MAHVKKELSQKETHDSLEERNKALQLKCTQQSERFRQLIEYNDFVIKAAHSLIHGEPENNHQHTITPLP